MSQCPNCGTQASGKFCPNCGAQIPDQPAAAAIPPQPQQYVQQPQPPMPQQQGYQPQYPPQYQPQPGYQMPPKKKGLGVFGWIGIITGVIAVIIVALVALGGGGGPAVTTPVISNSWTEGEKLPQSLETVSANSKIIYAIVDTKYDQPTEVTAKWYLDGEHATDLDTTESVTKDKNELAFHLTAEKGFPVGQYKVEIWVAGKKEAEKTFTVK